jgi:adenine-specific DNA-methyltransferase
VIERIELEAERVALQRTLDGQRTQAERNRLGQFATPPRLAASVMESALKLLPAAARVRFLDPAFGTGSFYSALLGIVDSSHLRHAMGYEIDREFGSAATRLWRPTGLVMRISDFTLAAPPVDADSKPNLLICNPPYVRHHHLDRKTKERLQVAVKRQLGIEISGLSGLYCYFMLVSHSWMADDGVAAWLIPSEFMDVGYGLAVKRYLLNHVETLRIHRFDPAEVQFDDALVSSCVVWFRKRKPMPDQTVAFTYGGSIETPGCERMVPVDELRGERKWTRFPTKAPRPATAHAKLGDFFVIRRGIATGANGSFIMTLQQARERDLPAVSLRPILPGPRHLVTDEVLAEPDGAPRVEPRLVLLDCRLSESQVRDKHPSLWRYLESIRPEVAGRYLCAHRVPWYAQEHRPVAPFLCTYIVRATARPFRFILNHSLATAANVYLLLYPRPHVARALEANPGLKRQVWQALNRCEGSTLLDEGRVYGGGLHKLEPKELARVPVDHLSEVLPTLPESERAPRTLFAEAVVRDAQRRSRHARPKPRRAAGKKVRRMPSRHRRPAD